MRKMLAAGVMSVAATAAVAFEDFGDAAAGRWYYVQDGVMGGLSQGTASLGDGVLRMRGSVSTANNGGFIQVRQRGFAPWATDASGLKVEAKGNGETYYIFLRTPDLNRFSWSFRATFEAGKDWQEIDLPFEAFKPSSPNMPQSFDPARVSSIGIVAYGREHEADVSVRSIALY